mmetsp:Transcript_9872/g.60142  ORF Transcript_9872/g.60142 Transcript_9872/m.60142 type:complete len:129 (-) Transcript_9872:1013-1399(-)
MDMLLQFGQIDLVSYRRFSDAESKGSTSLRTKCVTCWCTLQQCLHLGGWMYEEHLNHVKVIRSAGFRAFRECNDSQHDKCKHSCCSETNKNLREARCSSRCSLFSLYSFIGRAFLRLGRRLRAGCIQR